MVKHVKRKLKKTALYTVDIAANCIHTAFFGLKKIYKVWTEEEVTELPISVREVFENEGKQYKLRPRLDAESSEGTTVKED